MAYLKVELDCRTEGAPGVVDRLDGAARPEQVQPEVSPGQPVPAVLTRHRPGGAAHSALRHGGLQ